MSDRNWVIAGQPDDASPKVGGLYEIRHTRKGTFVGRILEVRGEWADVERIDGEIGWASNEAMLFGTKKPEAVSIRSSLVYLIEMDGV